MRELLSNANDAEAERVILAPLLSDLPGKPTGLLAWDNGTGMSRPVSLNCGKREDSTVRVMLSRSCTHPTDLLLMTAQGMPSVLAAAHPIKVTTCACIQREITLASIPSLTTATAPAEV